MSKKNNAEATEACANFLPALLTWNVLRHNPDQQPKPNSSWRTRYWLCLLLAIFFCLTVILQVAGHGFKDDFGGAPDEAAHYVTALMVRDYLLHGLSQPPVAFAENYYMHYPRVAFGHWPPVFYILLACWMTVFSDSRTSALLLLAALSAVTALLLYNAARRFLSLGTAVVIALLYILLPAVQLQNAMVMAEIPLTLFSFAAVLSLASFLDRDRWQDAALFGIWASLAIMTKGNAWALAAVPVLALLAMRQLNRFRNWRIWLSAGIVLVLCAPYTLWSLHMVKEGWESDLPTWRFIFGALPSFTLFLMTLIGGVLSACALCGLWTKIIVPLWHRKADVFWVVMASYVLSTLLFHALVPTSVEPRKEFMVIPALLLFAGAGIDWIAEWPAFAVIPARFRSAGAAVIVVAIFATFTFSLSRSFCSGFEVLARYLLSRPDLKNAVFLVSTGEANGEAEGRCIAEIAEHEKRPAHIVLRASKQLSKSNWLGLQYQLRYSSANEIAAELERIPVGVLIVHSMGHSVPHHVLLRQMVAERPGQWEKIYDLRPYCSRHGAKEEIVVYCNRRALDRAPAEIQIDLKNMLNRVLTFHM